MAHVITTPLDGKICQLNIKVGDKVDEDEEVMVIEAMKMETPIFAPCRGIIREIRIHKGDEVAENDVLAVVEKE